MSTCLLVYRWGGRGCHSRGVDSTSSTKEQHGGCFSKGWKSGMMSCFKYLRQLSVLLKIVSVCRKLSSTCPVLLLVLFLCLSSPTTLCKTSRACVRTELSAFSAFLDFFGYFYLVLVSSGHSSSSLPSATYTPTSAQWEPFASKLLTRLAFTLLPSVTSLIRMTSCPLHRPISSNQFYSVICSELLYQYLSCWIWLLSWYIVLNCLF